MSIFKESEWETDDTGDKLAKELFVSKKKSKPIIDKQSHKKLKENGKKKSAKLRPDDSSGEVRNPSAVRNKVDNKKRKSSTIEIDENIIKKWKSESMGRVAPKEGLKSLKPKSKQKTVELLGKERKTDDNAAATTKKTSKKKSSEIKKEREKLNNKTLQENDSENGDLMTKSQRRRLKHKEKLLKKKLENGENSALDSDNTKEIFGDKKDSSIAKESEKLDKSKLKIERLQTMLIAKQQTTSKNGGNTSEPVSLRDRMMARLKSSRFRYLNEQMYNSESWSSKKYFNEDPDAFLAYHEGYKLQVDQWPLNPLDAIIASVRRLPKDYVIADFGCGEGRLAESVPHKVHSLDLVAVNDTVTACDMAHTSLLTGRIDVVVFCLSLMGTNLTDYIIEANRVLRKDGILKIAEVESRFEDVDEFVKTLGSYGFVNTWKDLSHNLFYFMDFKKEGDITKKRNKLPPLELKSCLYKRR